MSFSTDLSYPRYTGPHSYDGPGVELRTSQTLGGRQLDSGIEVLCGLLLHSPQVGGSPKGVDCVPRPTPIQETQTTHPRGVRRGPEDRPGPWEGDDCTHVGGVWFRSGGAVVTRVLFPPWSRLSGRARETPLSSPSRLRELDSQRDRTSMGARRESKEWT